MKYCLQFISDLVDNQIKTTKAKRLLININGFDRPEFYFDIWNKVNEICQNRNKKFICKLSDEKFDEFNGNIKYQHIMHKFQENEIVANGEKLTSYRNLIPEEETVIILIGTEETIDSNSLEDFYSVDPKYIDDAIGNNFHFVFDTKYNNMLSEDDRNVIDNIYKNIFLYVPKNIFKLSCIVDKMPEYLDSIDDLKEHIFTNLYTDWGLANIESEIPTTKRIISSTKRIPILAKANTFLKRKGYDSISFINKSENKIKAYIDDQNAKGNVWKHTNIFASYEDFAETLNSYICGIDIEKNRELLCQIDFGIISSALDIKLPSSLKKKELTKFYDSPMLTFSKATIEFISKNKDIFNSQQVNLVFRINRIGLAGVISKEESIDLWNNICKSTGGLFDFLNREKFSVFGDKVLKLSFEQKDIFDIKNTDKLWAEGVIDKLSSGQKLCKVDFLVTGKNDNTTKETSYQWLFEPSADWISIFQDLDSDMEKMVEVNGGYYIPFATVEKIDNLFNVKNSNEFFERYSKKTIKYNTNLIEKFKKKYEKNYPQYYAKYIEIGAKFCKWFRTITTRGFYHSILDQSANEIVRAYIDYGDYVNNNENTEEFNHSLMMYVNAFLVCGSPYSVLKDIEVDKAVIPPYHPSTLEKITAKAVYTLWGLTDIFKCVGEEEPNKLYAKIDRLDSLSVINSSVDILVADNKYISVHEVFGYYTTYLDTSKLTAQELKSSDMMQNEGVLSDEYKSTEFNEVTPIAKIITNNIYDYVQTFPITNNGLEIVAINFTDFQPVVSALHRILVDAKSDINSIKLTILMPLGKQGGSNYLSYWADTFFDEDSDVKIKIYLNYYEKESEINNIISESTDITFYNDILKENKIYFSKKTYEANIISTSFPIAYRALPVATSSMKREMEISQLQFKAASIHSQVIYKKDAMTFGDNNHHLVVKEMSLDESISELIDLLHSKSKWVVCIGMGLDKRILFQNNTGKNYKIIGFTTGEGTYGEYNVTISARNSMIEDIKKKLKLKFKRMFCTWDDETISKATDNCIDKAKRLDGASLLKALNPNDYDINNFLAYLMTNQYLESTRKEEDKINVLVPLDMYRHWFEGTSYVISDNSNSRPDFLALSIRDCGDDGDIKINAKIIECKLAKENDMHIIKAYEQVSHGYKILNKLFSNRLESIERKYWFSQLYRVLTFNEINLMDNDEAFIKISDKLMKMLDGHFEINWSGSVMTFWVDSTEDGITIRKMSNENGIEISQYVFGQKMIKNYLLGKTLGNNEFKFDNSVLLDGKDKDVFEPDEQTDYETIKTKNTDEIEITEILDNDDANCEINKVHDLGEQKEEINEAKSDNQSDLEKKNEMSWTSSAAYGSGKICLGLNSNITNELIYWHFGDEKMSNRHILITGKSGQGKTYAIQGMMLEIVRQNIPVVIFDYTGGFVPDKMENIVKEELGDKIKQEIVLLNKLNFNPFKMQIMNIAGMEISEQPMHIGQRIADIFTHVYKFGDQQASAIYQACKNGLEKYNNKMTFKLFRNELELLDTKEAKSVLSKLMPFLDFDIFNFDKEFDWKDVIYNDGKVTVFQLSFVQSKDMQIAITEMILWDLWYYTMKFGKESMPFVVVLDEAQNLSFGDKAPTTKILTEGRKFGWSGWFATQFLKGQLKDEEINRLQQAALRIYFKPPENEIQSMAVSIDPEKKDLGRWINQLKKSGKGDCIVVGDGVYGTNNSKKLNPVCLKVPKMEER